MEVWIDIVGYEGFYKVSNLGRIKSLDRFSKHKEGGKQFIKGRILKQAYYRNGYCFVGLCVNGVTKQMMIHRLVAIHFLPNPDNLPQVNHKKGIKDDNRVSELEWVSTKENVHHSIITGLTNAMGKNNGYAHPVVIEKDGIKKFFDTQREAARFIGVKDVNIHTSKRTGYKCKGYKIYSS